MFAGIQAVPASSPRVVRNMSGGALGESGMPAQPAEGRGSELLFVGEAATRLPICRLAEGR